MKINIQADSGQAEQIVLTDEIAKAYDLDNWATNFTLMTAGYRDHIDVNDMFNPEAPFNAVTLLIMANAKARVFANKLKSGEMPRVHIGGEVRTHTQAFIKLLARAYAALGYQVHLRKEVSTTPIWYSSYGIFYEEFQSGENLTASHSPYFKGGWKALDAEGKQITDEEEAIIAELQRMIEQRETIELAPWTAKNIHHDFDIDQAYVSFQKTVFGAETFDTIKSAAEYGYHCMAAPLGGSMGATTRRLFKALGISHGADGIVEYFLDEENARFHKVGEHDGENHGADPSKSEIYKHVGAKEKLLSGQANVVFLWDPDGDRFNVVSLTSPAIGLRAAELGIEVEHCLESDQCIVYFTANQLYFLLAAYRIDLLKRSAEIDAYDWFIGASYPSSTALMELGKSVGIPFVQVPVGFRNLGNICRSLEPNIGKPQTFTTFTGDEIEFGPQPRALILFEESGGASLGGSDLMVSKTGRNNMLALREKDGMQISLLTLGLSASLFENGKTLAQQYCDLIEQHNIQYRYYERSDVPLYNESLQGDALKQAKIKGIANRDLIVNFFKELVEEYASQKVTAENIHQRIAARNPNLADALPKVKSAAWIGDGSMFTLQGMRLIIRASGTDALMRYYMDGTDQDEITKMAEFLAAIEI